MQFDQFFCKRKTNSHPSLSPAIGRVDLKEPLEDPRQVIDRNSKPGILDLDPNPDFPILHPYFDPAVSRSELDRVRDKVGQNDLQTMSIPWSVRPVGT